MSTVRIKGLDTAKPIYVMECGDQVSLYKTRFVSSSRTEGGRVLETTNDTTVFTVGYPGMCGNSPAKLIEKILALKCNEGLTYDFEETEDMLEFNGNWDIIKLPPEIKATPDPVEQ